MREIYERLHHAWYLITPQEEYFGWESAGICDGVENSVLAPVNITRSNWVLKLKGSQSLSSGWRCGSRIY